MRLILYHYEVNNLFCRIHEIHAIFSSFVRAQNWRMFITFFCSEIENSNSPQAVLNSQEIDRDTRLRLEFSLTPLSCATASCVL